MSTDKVLRGLAACALLAIQPLAISHGPAMAAGPQSKVDCASELAAIDQRLTRVKLNRDVAARFTALRTRALAEIQKGDAAACRLTIGDIHRVLGIDKPKTK